MSNVSIEDLFMEVIKDGFVCKNEPESKQEPFPKLSHYSDLINYYSTNKDQINEINGIIKKSMPYFINKIEELVESSKDEPSNDASSKDESSKDEPPIKQILKVVISRLKEFVNKLPEDYKVIEGIQHGGTKRFKYFRMIIGMGLMIYSLICLAYIINGYNVVSSFGVNISSNDAVVIYVIILFIGYLFFIEAALFSQNRNDARVAVHGTEEENVIQPAEIVAETPPTPTTVSVESVSQLPETVNENEPLPVATQVESLSELVVQPPETVVYQQTGEELSDFIQTIITEEELTRLLRGYTRLLARTESLQSQIDSNPDSSEIQRLRIRIEINNSIMNIMLRDIPELRRIIIGNLPRQGGKRRKRTAKRRRSKRRRATRKRRQSKNKYL